jgi:hypothetical protein
VLWGIALRGPQRQALTLGAMCHCGPWSQQPFRLISGAISPASGEPTDMGKKMSDLPLTPSLSVVLMHAASMGCAEEVGCQSS